MSRPDLRRLARGCLLHDIGKVFVPPAILTKEGPVTSEEWDLLCNHTTWGYELFSSTYSGEAVVNHIAYQHHERQDGSGYPRGLSGLNTIDRSVFGQNRILLLAEITAVADVHDALSSDRPYRPALTPEVVARSIAELAGTHLNREIVVLSGYYRGYTGVVSRVDPPNLSRPTVRLLADEHGSPIDPIEVHLNRHPEIMITSLMNVPTAAGSTFVRP